MSHINRAVHRIWHGLFVHTNKEALIYIRNHAFRTGFIYLFIIVLAIIFVKYFFDTDQLFTDIFDRYNDLEILTLFIVSESSLGIVPPDLFMLWTAKFSQPLVLLTLLGVLSYSGGVISYRIGHWISRKKTVRDFLARWFRRYIEPAQRWGGAFIFISAMFPFSPYPMVVLAISMMKYPFNRFLLFGLFRIVRFIVGGIFLLGLVELTF